LSSCVSSAKIRELAAVSDLITVEIEHVDVTELSQLVAEGYAVHPHPEVVAIIQDKHRQKLFLQSHGIAVPEFMDCPTADDALTAAAEFGCPFMLKNKKLAYDGRGNAVVRDKRDVESAFARLGGKGVYAEKWVPFVKELAVMVVGDLPFILCE
jgi:phosphoribosylaminoimidazole carboxylase